jgi:hypothetical protein
MNEIYNGNKDVKAAADAKQKSSKNMTREVAVEEVLAEKAEQEVTKAEGGKKFSLGGALKQLINYIRRFARSMGLPLKDVTDLEIAELIANSRRFVSGTRMKYDRFTEGVAADRPLAAGRGETLASQGEKTAEGFLDTFGPAIGPNKVDPTTVNRSTEQYIKNRADYNKAKGFFGINKLKAMTPDLRSAMMKIMTLRMIKDSFGSVVPQIDRTILSTERMIGTRNTIMKDGQEITNKTLDIMKEKGGSDDIQLMGELAIQATMLGVDPDPQGKFHKPNKELDDAWALLSRRRPKAIEVYREMRNFFEKQLREMYADVKQRVESSFTAAQLKDPAEKARLDSLLKELDEQFKPLFDSGPYFPLRRFGQYWFQVGEGKDKEFYMFESAFDRDFWMEKRKETLPSDTRVVSGDKIRGQTDSLHSSMASEALFQKIDSLVDKLDVKGKDPVEVKEDLKDSIKQLHYILLPAASMRKMFLSRKNIPGASTDIVRVFSSSLVNMAYQRARTKYAGDIYENIEQGFQSIDPDVTTLPRDKQQAARDVLLELESRVPHILGIEPTTGAHKYANYLTQASFLWLLTAPASAILNILGMVAVGMPYLVARHGFGAVPKMLEYAKKYAATVTTRKDGVTIAPTLEKSTALSPIQKEAYDIFAHDNTIDATLSFDAMGLAERPTEQRGLLTNRLVEGLTFLFHHSERMNREIMSMAAFDLAYDKYSKDKKLTGEQARDKAIQEAKDLVSMSLGDFTRATRAPIFTSPPAKVIFQFKQYSLLMTYNMLKNTYDGFNPLRKNLTADEKALAKEARRRMYGVLGMTALFAGLKGMPIFGAVGAMIEAMSSLGDDEDEIVDFEFWLDGYLRDTLGGTAAASIMRGAIPQISGSGLSERMSLDIFDLWLRDSGYQKTAEDSIKEQILTFLGPTVSIGLNIARGVDTVNNGQTMRGIESLVPSVGRNLLVVGRFYEDEGAKTKKGAEIVSDITPAEYLSQALGFTPERILAKQRAVIRRKTEEATIEAKKERLYNRLFFALMNDDEDNFEETLDGMTEFSDKYPELAFNTEDIQRSMINRMKSIAEEEAFGGVSKKLAGRLGMEIRTPD